jgi:hypothetical protein
LLYLSTGRAHARLTILLKNLDLIQKFTEYLFDPAYRNIISSIPLMIILSPADNIDNQVIKGYKKGVKENEGDQSEIRRSLPAASGLAKADHPWIPASGV